MKIKFKKGQWLRSEIKEVMKRDYPNLVKRQTSLLIQFGHFCKASNQWWLMLLLVFVGIYVGTLINYTRLNFITLDYKTATQLVDQRSSNLATIISISLVVVGFMINNLAIKEPVVYKLLFRRTPLYLIMYLTLSTIGAFVITSTLRDTFNEDRFSRMVLAGTYFVLLILLFIGGLFRTIVTITDPKKLNQMLSSEILYESTLRLRRFLYWKLGHQRIRSFMTALNVKDKYFLMAVGNQNNLVVDRDQESLVLHDLEFTQIESFVRKDPNGLLLTNPEFSLGDRILQPDELLWNNNSANMGADRKDLHKCIKLRKAPKEIDEFRGYFDAKFEELVSAGKHRDLGVLMDTYLDLYELEMINRVSI